MATRSDTEERRSEHAAAQGTSQNSSEPCSDDKKGHEEGPAVRFSSSVEEIAPEPRDADATSKNKEETPSSFTEVAADKLKAITQQMQYAPLQERRMSTFQFEPYSLPASRVQSREDDSSEVTRQSTANSPSQHTPHESPRLSGMASPPLTPAGSEPSRTTREADKQHGSAAEPETITPAQSSSQEKSPFVTDRQPLTHRPASADHLHHIRRASSAEHHKGDKEQGRKATFYMGGADSVPVSRETSPNRSPAAHFYSKPMALGGDLNDPYAKGRRPPQQNASSRHNIDSRFVFKKKKPSSPGSSKANVSEKRVSGIFNMKNSNDELGSHYPPQSSMADLKRFFRKSGHFHHPHNHQHHRKGDSSPPTSVKASSKSNLSLRPSQQFPFGDDHGLSTKYGKLGKVLGSGAGGSVRLMKRRDDGTVFAVKEFRARHTYETEKEYNKKVTAEFCVGSTLHHGNIIETLDILHEKGHWYEVMEYAPYDLFAIVMSGKMSRPEITCCFLQILNGMTYLHSLGLAHRDLKLDNVVVSEKGIMKIIDFGSSHVFKYPFESDVVPANGIVGSDPYLAPEVYDSKEYNAAAVDIWSLAIIYCCMILRRFPWKIPRMTDHSFKLFASDPTPGHDPKKLVPRPKSTNDLHGTVAREFIEEGDHKKPSDSGHGQQPEKKIPEKKIPEKKPVNPSYNVHPSQTVNPSYAGTSAAATQGVPGIEKKDVIKGPWRILRLLPRESRHIIHRMLDINPKTRADMEEILQETWIADTVICRQLDSGEVISAKDHTHVLEPPATQTKQT